MNFNPMKKIVFVGILTILIASCKPDIKGELGESFSKVDGINGSWQLTTFHQRDENNPIKEVRDLSEYYLVPGEQPTQIVFHKDSFTYEVVPGPGRNFFGTHGNWRFDNNQAPSYIYLENATDTLRLTLGSMPRAFENLLTLELPRYCTDAQGVQTPTVTYIFTIQRMQE